MIVLFVVACGVVGTKLFLQRRVSRGFLIAMTWWQWYRIYVPGYKRWATPCKNWYTYRQRVSQTWPTHTEHPNNGAFQGQKLWIPLKIGGKIWFFISRSELFTLFISRQMDQQIPKNQTAPSRSTTIRSLKSNGWLLNKSLLLFRPHARPDRQLLSRYFTQCYSKELYIFGTVLASSYLVPIFLISLTLVYAMMKALTTYTKDSKHLLMTTCWNEKGVSRTMG